jgi:glycosyltransferase involved in cell wall biosynthesis
MKTRLLFLADSSISNPILHSQGIPLCEFLSKHQFETYFVTFEMNPDSSKIQEIIKRYEFSKINFITVKTYSGGLLPGGTYNLIAGLFIVLKTIKKNKISIVHSRSMLPTIIALIAKMLFFNKIKVLYDNRGLLIEEEILKGNWTENSIKVKILKKIESIITKKVDQIVVVSNSFKKLLLNKNESNRFLENKINVIINRTEMNDIISHKILDRKPKNMISGVFSGSAMQWQNIHALKNFVNMTAKIFPNFEFNIFSYNPTSFERFISEIDSGIRVNIKQLDSNQVFEELLKNNFGVLIRGKNDINKVAFPLKFAEYLAAGLPVIVSEGIGNLSEFVNHHHVGVVLKDENILNAVQDIKKLLMNNNIYNHCREIAEKYLDINLSFKEYFKVYNNI